MADPAPTPRHTLSVRRKTYRGAAGWSVVGHPPVRRVYPVSIFTPDRAVAVAIRDALIAGHDDLVNPLLTGEVAPGKERTHA
jgi:hypothetical protein